MDQAFELRKNSVCLIHLIMSRLISNLDQSTLNDYRTCDIPGKGIKQEAFEVKNCMPFEVHKEFLPKCLHMTTRIKGKIQINNVSYA